MREDITHTDAVVRLDARISILGKVLMGDIKMPVDAAFADVCGERTAVKAQIESERRQFRNDLNAIAEAAGIATDCASPSVGVIMTHVHRLRQSSTREGMTPHDPFPGPSEEERRRVWADAFSADYARGDFDANKCAKFADAALAAFDARFPQGGAK